MEVAASLDATVCDDIGEGVRCTTVREKCFDEDKGEFGFFRQTSQSFIDIVENTKPLARHGPSPFLRIVVFQRRHLRPSEWTGAPW